MRAAFVVMVLAAGCGASTVALDASPGSADARAVTGADAPAGSVPDAPPGSLPDAPPGSLPDAPPGSLPDAPPGSLPDAPPGSLPDAASPRDGGPVTGAPALGAHRIAYHIYGSGVAPISTAPMTTQSSGSTLIVGIGRGGVIYHQLPTDNKGNSPFQQIGTVHTYALWGESGTALYAFPNAAGGANHVITASTPDYDEITMAAIEVRNGGTVRDFSWVERLKGNAITSQPVTTTGPALLIAFWWGDADPTYDKTATANNGFQVIDAVLPSGSLVQCAVAVKAVDAAGTYDVTWTATPAQGAQLWLVAVE